jgi:putative zinc finger/helix-turn-helix YgiT family protein
MNSTTNLRACPACKQGHLHPALRTRTFHPRGIAVEVELLSSECDHCHVQTTRAAQHDENLRRLAARKAAYGGLLMGEEILSLRKRYGLTQQAAAKIFGKGKIAFSRYENETTFPDDSTTRLLEAAIEKPALLKWLADKADVDLPLWKERCEDEQRVNVRPLAKVYDAAQAGTKHQERYVSFGSAAKLGSLVTKVLSAHLVATRQTLMLPESATHVKAEASNEGRMEREAIAS